MKRDSIRTVLLAAMLAGSFVILPAAHAEYGNYVAYDNTVKKGVIASNLKKRDKTEKPDNSLEPFKSTTHVSDSRPVSADTPITAEILRTAPGKCLLKFKNHSLKTYKVRLEVEGTDDKGQPRMRSQIVQKLAPSESSERKITRCKERYDLRVILKTVKIWEGIPDHVVEAAEKRRAARKKAKAEAGIAGSSSGDDAGAFENAPSWR